MNDNSKKLNKPEADNVIYIIFPVWCFKHGFKCRNTVQDNMIMCRQVLLVGDLRRGGEFMSLIVRLPESAGRGGWEEWHLGISA